MEKQCTKCKEQKDILEFSPDSRRKDGLQSKCKVCRSLEAKERRIKKDSLSNPSKKLDTNDGELLSLSLSYEYANALLRAENYKLKREIQGLKESLRQKRMGSGEGF
jgi:hypothetical protein